MFDRLQQKPEHERRRLFWFYLLGAGAIVFALWALSFSASLKNITLRKNPEEAGDKKVEEVREKFSSLKAVFFERLPALTDILPFLKNTVPEREEIIK
jgi:hypothetical protein